MDGEHEPTTLVYVVSRWGEPTQTFSAGLRALEERGLRTSPDEPLH